jgi:hypothetical protein
MINLRGLPIEDAVLSVRRKMDREFAIDLGKQREMMVRDGLSCDDINGLIDHHILGYLAQRNSYLDELHARLLARDRRLH